MAKRKRSANRPENPMSPLMRSTTDQYASALLATVQPFGAVEAFVLVMVPTQDGGCDTIATFAWPLEQGRPSEMMLDAVDNEIASTRRENR